jgi:N-acetylglucosamine-6-phosphate deacetylase
VRLGVAAALVDGVAVPGDVEVDHAGRIASVGLAGAGSGTAAPGLVDLQVNGFAGIDLRRADEDGYRTVAHELARRGATAVLPTFHSQRLVDHERSLEVLARVHAAPPPGCRFLGAHLEGPFLSPARRGAHESQHLLRYEDGVLERLLAAGPVAAMTLAPELEGITRGIAQLVRSGVLVSIGHSEASSSQVRAAIGAGAAHVTHCWNAMAAPTAREPGPVGVALGDPRVAVGLIADLVHVAPDLVRATWAAASGRVAATCDAVAAAGTQDVRGARLADGTLAGGTSGPDDCLRNLVDCGATLAGAVHACGGVQRRLLGLPEVRVRPGDPAELVVLDDDLRVLRTIVGRDVIDAA